MNLHRGWMLALPIIAAAALAPASALAASDLAITKIDSADPATENTELIYTITVVNGGPDAAGGVVVSDDLPKEVSFVAVTASQGTCDNKGPKISCELGTLASGATATVSIRVIAKKAGQVSNTATVSTTDTDSNQTNNTDTETTTVVAQGGGGGGGNTGATCGGKNATIVGTTGADTLVGTTKNDVIFASGGDDVIRGLGGKDIVCGASGNDMIKGGADDDLLKGGGGNDQLRGGGGDDRLRGGGGDDRLAGGSGNDSLSGGRGNDTCRGGSGTDTDRSC